MEGVLRIFSPLKIRRLRPGLNPRTWVDHRSRYVQCYLSQCSIASAPYYAVSQFIECTLDTKIYQVYTLKQNLTPNRLIKSKVSVNTSRP